MSESPTSTQKVDCLRISKLTRVDDWIEVGRIHSENDAVIGVLLLRRPDDTSDSEVTLGWKEGDLIVPSSTTSSIPSNNWTRLSLSYRPGAQVCHVCLLVCTHFVSQISLSVNDVVVVTETNPVGDLLPFKVSVGATPINSGDARGGYLFIDEVDFFVHGIV